MRRLAAEVRALRRDGPTKAVAFVEYLETALHVTQELRRRVGGLRVATTADERRGRRLALKPAAERRHLRERFSPRSHGLPPQPDDPEVLICTDADGVGVNLQDASVVVVYDLPDGADGLIQRLGRILRPSPVPARTPTVLTFVPALALKEHAGGVGAQVATRYARLRHRQDASTEILGSGVLPSSGVLTETISLETPFDVAAALTGGVEPTSTPPLATHLDVWGAHRGSAGTLEGRALHTSRVRGGPDRLAVVFRAGGRVRAVVANPRAARNRDLLVSDDEAEALALLACPPDAERATALAAPPDRIVRATERVIRVWCEREGVDPGGAERIVAVYLAKGDPAAPPRAV